MALDLGVELLLPHWDQNMKTRRRAGYDLHTEDISAEIFQGPCSFHADGTEHGRQDVILPKAMGWNISLPKHLLKLTHEEGRLSIPSQVFPHEREAKQVNQPSQFLFLLNWLGCLH